MIRFYLNEEGAKAVAKTNVSARKDNSAYVEHTLCDEHVAVDNGNYYFPGYGDLPQSNISKNLEVYVSLVTATYTAPEKTMVRESGVYEKGDATAIVEPYMVNGKGYRYETYSVTYSGKTLKGVKELHMAIIEGSIRPTKSLHGPQGGMPTEDAEKLLRLQSWTVVDLRESLDHARKVIDDINPVYADHQRVIDEQREFIQKQNEILKQQEEELKQLRGK